ncbi:hypothetical protein AB4562_00745 [Vibrio sp. 10N.222.54.A1]|uniref:Uncharacterized protein n=2 Tax=Vibrio cyclitrophicus TaxID=47951 RepID=A0A7Z1MG60_9VIBR|nr:MULTISPECIES: hypothetical protein [Vibrio]PMK82289.1 hypothetical protein BCT92_13720 [Vibrio sp. 10N.261.52.E5]PMP17391.1 hypothetical protein BCS91_25910 [Vibrio cyclitrophicus]PMP25758.1 hypothetical protein BCS90_24630 [Vibrio cyclitrophicus]TKF84901.1 hypothetical protein FCV65_04125 [Vibrio sp. F13]TKF93599.1 hypothetical protein FCV67_25080 [Vibrio sp. F13]
MENTYDIFCFIGVSIFLGIGLWFALEAFWFQASVEPIHTSALHIQAPQKTELLFNSSENLVLYGSDEILKIKRGSTNHRFISYLFDHEGQDIPIEQLYRDLKLPENTYIKKLIANTKLPREIRNQAFVLSGSTINFKASLH